jgi:class 3 adenylate cyclase
MTATRRLAAILAADVAGYSRLIGADEEGTLNRLRSIRIEVIDPKITEQRGRIVKTTGDGFLVEFSSVVDALRCATAWQHGMGERNAAAPDDNRIEFRIGVHQGDIVVEDDDILGDGVNVAARLEGLAEPGSICVSARVQEDVAGRLDLTFDDLGEQNLKNITRPVRVYRVRLATAKNTPKVTPTQSGPVLTLPDKPSIAVLPFQNMSGDPEQEYFADGMVEEIITAPHPLAVRYRSEFELHLQRSKYRREAGGARTRRSLCARRLGSQSRPAGAYHRPVNRCRSWHASLGRSL